MAHASYEKACAYTLTHDGPFCDCTFKITIFRCVRCFSINMKYICVTVNINRRLNYIQQGNVI